MIFKILHLLEAPTIPISQIISKILISNRLSFPRSPQKRPRWPRFAFCDTRNYAHAREVPPTSAQLEERRPSGPTRGRIANTWAFRTGWPVSAVTVCGRRSVVLRFGTSVPLCRALKAARGLSQGGERGSRPEGRRARWAVWRYLSGAFDVFRGLGGNNVGIYYD